MRSRPVCDLLEPRRLLAVIYVDINTPATTQSQNGSSWTRAYKQLSTALPLAVSGDVIRVADGTYTPGAFTTDSFALREGVSILGGYAGAGAAVPDARDPSKTPAVLSGVLAASGSTRIVTGGSVTSSAVLDGFYITHGSNGYPASYGGLALYLNSATPTIRNCVFAANYSQTNGGAVEIFNTTSAVNFENCVFRGNTSYSAPGAAAIYIQSARATLTNCEFYENYSSQGVITLQNAGSQLTATNCIFSENDSKAIYAPLFVSGVVTITGCTFTGNDAAIDVNGVDLNVSKSRFIGNRNVGINAVNRNASISQCEFIGNKGTALNLQVINASVTNCSFAYNAPTSSFAQAQAIRLTGTGTVSAVNCLVWGNSGFGVPVILGTTATMSYSNVQVAVAGTGNISMAPTFIDAVGPDGIAGTGDDDLRLRPTSAGVDAGDNAAAGLAGVTTDLAGAPRFADVLTTADTGNGAAPMVDIGAYEASPAVDADAYGPYRVPVGGEVTLRSYGYSDDPGPLTFEWDFDDDGEFDDATGPAPVFSAAAIATAARKTVRLRMTDALSRTVIKAVTVKVIPQLIYVDDSAVGANNGGSWADAYTSLKAAMIDAFEGAEIRIAQGVYRPSTGYSTAAPFAMKSGFNLRGGYAGFGAADPDARSVTSFKSTLSGDIGMAGFRPDNMQVLSAINVTNWVLEGVTVAEGRAYSAANYSGGGMVIVGGTQTIRDCTFEFNSTDVGGAVAVGPSVSAFINCVFRANHGGRGGAVAFTGSSALHSASFLNCQFLANDSGVSGAALWISATFPTASNRPVVVNNCVFVGNVSRNYSPRSGIISNEFSSPFITAVFNNCTFAGNLISIQAEGSRVIFNGDTGGFELNNCISWGNTVSSIPTTPPPFHSGTMTARYSDIQTESSSVQPGVGNIRVDPQFTRNPSRGADSLWGTADDDYGDLTLKNTSPTIDVGSNALVPAALSTDHRGAARFVNFPGVQNSAGVVVDMGAYESTTPLTAAGPSYLFDAATPTVRIAFSANLAPASLSATDLELLNLSTGETIDVVSLATAHYVASVFAAEFRFSAQLSDGNYRATLPAAAVSDAGGAALAGPIVGDFFVLAADANRDRSVSLDDFTVLAANFGQNGRVFSQGNFNYSPDGAVNLDDFTILAAQFGKSLPAAGDLPSSGETRRPGSGSAAFLPPPGMFSRTNLWDEGDETYPSLLS